MLNITKTALQNKFFHEQLNFFWSGLWLLKLENHLRSQVAYEVPSKCKSCLKVLKKLHAYLWVTETFFTHNLNTVYHIMKLFVDEFIRKAKFFCIYCINEDVWIKNLSFIWLLLSGSINRSHCNASLFWERKNTQNVGYYFKASLLLSKLFIFLPNWGLEH